MIGIYKITSPSGKIYVGRSKKIERRFSEYKSLRKCDTQIALYNSLKKYGPLNHIYEILEECIWEDINKRERYWQDYYNVIGSNGLNCQLTKTDKLSFVYKEETLNKLRNKVFTEEIKRNMSKGQFGKKDTEETKLKKSLSRIGMKFSEEHKKKIRENHWKNREVINLETGIYYSSAKEAAKTINIPYSRLHSMLYGRYYNKTNFIWSDNYENALKLVK